MKNKLTGLSILMLILIVAFAIIVLFANPFTMKSGSAISVPILDSGQKANPNPSENENTRNSTSSYFGSQHAHTHHGGDDGDIQSGWNPWKSQSNNETL